MILAIINWDTTISVVIGAIPTTIFALAAWKSSNKAITKTEETHHAVNSRMDKFLEDQKISHAKLIEEVKATARLNGIRQAEDTAKTVEKVAERAAEKAVVEIVKHPPPQSPPR